MAVPVRYRNWNRSQPQPYERRYISRRHRATNSAGPGSDAASDVAPAFCPLLRLFVFAFPGKRFMENSGVCNSDNTMVLEDCSISDVVDATPSPLQEVINTCLYSSESCRALDMYIGD